MDHQFLAEAKKYRDRLAATPSPTEFRNLWRATNLPYRMTSDDPLSSGYKTEVLGLYQALTNTDYDVGQ